MLPELSEPPSVTSTSTNSVNLAWTPWREGSDAGDPPLEGYALYANISSGDITEVKTVEEAVTSATVTGLEPDTDYVFSVAAVREGTGGTGPRSPSVNAITDCGSKFKQHFSNYHLA